MQKQRLDLVPLLCGVMLEISDGTPVDKSPGTTTIFMLYSKTYNEGINNVKCYTMLH